jgi:hypothetical protein
MIGNILCKPALMFGKQPEDLIGKNAWVILQT